jgi:Na+-driven multidrug efflux pump
MSKMPHTAYAIAPIAGQNFGAKLPQRVRDTVWKAIYIESALMAILTLVCQIEPRWFVHFFTKDEQVIEVGARNF